MEIPKSDVANAMHDCVEVIRKLPVPKSSAADKIIFFMRDLI